MTRRQTLSTLAATGAVLAVMTPLTSAAVKLTTTPVSTGLNRPLFAVSPPGDSTRLFIVEQRGVIQILNLSNNTTNGTPFLDIDSIVYSPNFTSNPNDERGLLGLAFHPNYATNGFFYVNYTNNSANTVIARYHVSANPNIADAASAQTVISVTQPFSNHNGGWLGFSPIDGYLYIAMGDGGSSCDPNNNAPTITNMKLGKILRLDVNTDGFADVNTNYGIPPTNPLVGVTGDDEIWAYGVRNPWRPSFDRLTGDLWIADVGQNAWEEINFQSAAVAVARNYGWACNEGNHCAATALPNGSGCTTSRVGFCVCNDPNFTYPILEYQHAATGGCSITGGYVYRGPAIPDLQGTYFYTDFCNNRLSSLRYNGTTITDLNTNRNVELGTLSGVASFGEDGAGEMYIVQRGGATTGAIRKIIRACAITIVNHPLTQSVNLNGNVTLSVSVSGAVGGVTYTWRKNGATFGAANSPSLMLSNVGCSDAGVYRCDVQDTCDNVIPSNNATLTVIDPVGGDCNSNGTPDVCDLGVLGGGFTTNATASVIPDNGLVATAVNAAQQVFVTDVNVQINVSHTATGNLTLTLARLNTTVTLATGVGGVGDNFGNTVFDQQAATSITAGVPPYAGTFRPQNTLDAFNSMPKAGIWTMTVQDGAAGDTGTLLSWSLVTVQRLTADCNTDGSPDVCQLGGQDCNTNNSLDMCEAVLSDCNTNATPDACEVAGNDCNTNGTTDACDPDADHDGIPDACDCQTCAGDISGDNRVDATDVAGWVRCMLGASLPADACVCAGGMSPAQFIDRLLHIANPACP